MMIARRWAVSATMGAAMGREVERKFLVTGEGWRAHARPGVRMRQGYLASDPACSVRVRIEGDRARLNIKSATLGVERLEYEYDIPVRDAEEMLAHLCTTPPVEKVRYRVPWGGHEWEVDVFEGANAGLVLAEIELARPDEPFERPPWVGEEVSHDPRYCNVTLARHPYREWGRAQG